MRRCEKKRGKGKKGTFGTERKGRVTNGEEVKSRVRKSKEKARIGGGDRSRSDSRSEIRREEDWEVKDGRMRKLRKRRRV